MAGRFKKISRIGRGTFGEAWLVTSTCSGRKYVIKEVRVDEMSEEELEKTRTEATILARCKHNSIIRYKEYFMLPDPATMCLVMEYADGGDLAEKVKAAKQNGMTIPESTILHWFIQVIFAVQYLHSNNILHRDLKTQNIFLTKTNLVKVGDFGIARFLRDKQDLATTAIGTPYYLSPEICQRKPYNHKSDMWAVGCILYELCVLRHPFDAENFEDLVIKILKGAFRPLPSSFSSLLKDLISVMLRTNPERRPTADALLMLPALRPYVENYLMQYEELINSKRDRACSSDDRQPVKSILDEEERSPEVELPSNLKVRDLDKLKSANENLNHENMKESQNEKKQEGDAVIHQTPVLVGTPRAVKSDRLHSLNSSSFEGDPLSTPPKDLCLRQVNEHPLSSPKSPLFVKMSRKYSTASNSPVQPPAPPNTPVNKHFSNTPPNVNIVNILSLYPYRSGGSSSDKSPSSAKYVNGLNSWKTSCQAPTPYNTPSELKIPFNVSPSSDDCLGVQSLSPYSTPSKIPNTSVPSHNGINSSDYDPLSTPVKEAVYKACSANGFDSACWKELDNYVYPSRKCRSCGRGFGETYVIEKRAILDHSSDSVFDL